MWLQCETKEGKVKLVSKPLHLPKIFAIRDFLGKSHLPENPQLEYQVISKYVTEGDDGFNMAKIY
jgi:hypothetical protein